MNRHLYGNQKGEIVMFALFTGLIIVTSLFFLLPMWNVWKAGLAGESDLKRAEQTKKIMVEAAKAEKESAQLRADAISIMGKAAKEYRQQEFMRAFGEARREGHISHVIYVPTEANVPILDTGKR